MSLGPTKQENFVIPLANRIKFAIKNTFAGYFERPLFYLFYIMLPTTVLGLIFGIKFPYEYYGILLVLAGIEIYRHFLNKPK